MPRKRKAMAMDESGTRDPKPIGDQKEKMMVTTMAITGTDIIFEIKSARFLSIIFLHPSLTLVSKVIPNKLSDG